MLTTDPASPTPLYQQLYEQIRKKILSGEYAKGIRLTSTRELAKQLCVGRNTVENAYAQLCLEGYVESKRGSGFVVQDIAQETLQPITNSPESAHFSVSVKPKRTQPTHGDEQNYQYDFQCFNLDHSTFPFSIWKRLTYEALSSLEAQQLSLYSDKQGDLALRHEIMRYLHDARGVHCAPEQIVLCCGTQYALEILCGVLPAQSTTIGMEEPGYDGARIVFANNGLKTLPIPVTDEGLNVGALQRSATQAVYVTPSHQFPTGAVMPIHHRMKLLQWAQQTNSVIIEDDYDSEFHYHSRPIPALQSIDTHGRVIYLGTFSKSLAPGLRMSYVVLPLWLLERYREKYGRYHNTVPWIQQQIMAQFMAKGHWKRHLRKVSLVNRKRHDTLLKQLHTKLGEQFLIHSHNAGLHLLIEHNKEESQEALLEQAKTHGVRVYSTRPYWQNPQTCPNGQLLLGFSQMTEEQLCEAVDILATAWL